MAAEWDIDKTILDRFYPMDRQRVVIEVGAAMPDFLSFSNGFRSHGWKVITVEPNPIFCAAHRAKGYEVHEYACSDADADDVDFFVVDSKGHDYHGGKVTFESFSSLGITGQFDQLHDTVRDRTSTSKIKVCMRKLDSILAYHEPNINKVDVIAIDVEGWEIAVMQGFNTDRYKPDVVMLENLFNTPDYRDYMFSKGYYLWETIGHNEIYARKP